MIFEHFALNVEHPVEMAKWYADNFEMKVVRSMDKYPFTHFVADKTDRVIMELYSNTTAKFPDHKNAHFLEFHFAFMVDDPQSYKNKLINAGAKEEEDIKLDDGTNILTFRDPFGVCVQLCKRGKPLMELSV